MSYFAVKDPSVFTEPHGSKNFPIFTEKNAPIAGVTASDAAYYNTAYPAPGVHEDNEGFYVYAGHGYARVGDEEQPIAEGSCFYAPAGVPHQVRRAEDCEAVRVFLFHFR